jgi:hypothetical protein
MVCEPGSSCELFRYAPTPPVTKELTPIGTAAATPSIEKVIVPVGFAGAVNGTAAVKVSTDPCVAEVADGVSVTAVVSGFTVVVSAPVEPRKLVSPEYTAVTVWKPPLRVAVVLADPPEIVTAVPLIKPSM